MRCVQCSAGMKLPTLTAADRRWMKNRLSKTGWLAVGLLSVHFVTAIPSTKSGHRPRDRDGSHPDRVTQTTHRSVGMATATASELPAAKALASASEQEGAGTLTSIPPAGWRRTNRGWENTSTWAQAKPSLESLMERQAAREPALARSLLAKVSGCSPVAFAMFQIATIIAIACLAKLAEQERVAKPQPREPSVG